MPRDVVKAKAREVFPELKDMMSKELEIALLERGDSHIYQSQVNGVTRVISFCQPREWDSQFFGLKMATLQTFIMNETVADIRLVEECVGRAIEESYEEEVACVISRVERGTPVILRALEKVGFRTYDEGCSFKYQSLKKQEEQYNNQQSVSKAAESDVWELISLASHLYDLDHYHQDPRIGKNAANAMYGVWIRNLFFDNKCIVAVTKESDELSGFVTIREVSRDQKTNNRKYHIDLIGVAKEFRGRGIGHSLINWVLRHVPKNSQITVATQMTNLAAVQLYLSQGFTPSKYYATLHLWH